MASDPQFRYSVVEYLNDAIIRLSWRTADVLPAWKKNIPNVQDRAASSAKFLASIADCTSALLEKKISLTRQLQEADQAAQWEILNQMSGLRGGVGRQEVKIGDGALSATMLLNTALQSLIEFDGKLTTLLDEARQIKDLVEGVAGRQLKEPVPHAVAVLLNDMSAYNDLRRKTFWNLLDSGQSWKIDPARSNIHKRLAAPGLNDYPQAEVLWARFISPQVEAIAQEASSVARSVQIERGKWQLIDNNLNNVARLLGGDNETDRISWYFDPFSLFARTQLRMMKEVGTLCAQHS